eukprot:CAMPEP_0185260646 /NCGR_PEP_ID=MMETSP1359-20130426/9215_1 /TAXON_ID=552665 /ORGANISM="Bigelowiella longifila, Strain CCMP242" /LENGTH=112 /DNA_ID=CAMNT_0027847009 /DNA_START=897 /DNA_END=1233 /DNA_ORIENTATION=+
MTSDILQRAKLPENEYSSSCTAYYGHAIFHDLTSFQLLPFDIYRGEVAGCLPGIHDACRELIRPPPPRPKTQDRLSLAAGATSQRLEVTQFFELVEKEFLGSDNAAMEGRKW